MADLESMKKKGQAQAAAQGAIQKFFTKRTDSTSTTTESLSRDSINQEDGQQSHAEAEGRLNTSSPVLINRYVV